MKKLICLMFASVFYLLGVIGLIIPIIPQIPFFIIGTIFLIIGFEDLKEKILESNFYKQHLKDFVDKNSFLKRYLVKKNRKITSNLLFSFSKLNN